ncbi:substrate-binding domain-containing protein [Roseospirillum parvum]|uniref:Molybdate transport system substrate-binding protein n=1 Tax=Roseospirillum parvum TaxID=83401 RepID=A0A1G7V1U7_9PROT|nr:substrate-binding domain-containing protein [Roseospirillum parvum]SDG53792.1 molybdate transport system substrate-binding protein [Roseospirillum parvum]
MAAHSTASFLRGALCLVLALLLSACDDGNDGDDGDDGARPAVNLLVYCGITMVHPMKDIAALLEAETGIATTISQGGSEDLYNSLESSRLGDLYLPGSASYRERHLSQGLLGEAVLVGYNQAALMVPKDNPLGLDADLAHLVRPDLAVVIANPDTGSIGRETKRILQEAGLYEAAIDNSLFLATDSRNLNRALIDGTADLTLNWRATAFFEENRAHIAPLDLDPKVAEPKKLMLNLLTFSQHPEAARAFMELATSERGQAIFRRWGFLDNAGRGD